jgi:hypothetical protein
MELQAFEVSLKLLYLGAISIHRILLDVAHLIDLVDDDLGVAVSDELLDSQETAMCSPWIKASYSAPLLDAL